MGFGKVWLFCLLAVAPLPALAQSFFLPPGIEPTTGVDRGSTSQIMPVDAPTRFVTVGNDGAEAIGRAILSFSLATPDVFRTGDQIDLVGVIGGPSETGGRELLAAGIGYRLDLGEGLTLFANADHSDFRLGTAEALPFDVRGTVTNAALGVTREWTISPIHRRRATLSFGARSEDTRFIAGPTTDEDLRLIRVSLRDEKGIPFLFGRRFSLSATKGLSGFGASEAGNPLASAPGVDPDFFRISAAAEASIPLGDRLLLNAGVIGQWSDDSLPLSQRCGYGTNTYARGFDRSYVNGDQCLGGRVELAWDIDRPDLKSGTLKATQLFAGIDAGVVRDNANAILPGARDEWSSLSAGVRVLRDGVLGEVLASRILDQPAGGFEQSRSRLWVRLAVRF